VKKAVRRLFVGKRALRRRTNESHRILVGETKVDEKLGIVDFDRESRCRYRLFEWQGEVKREHRALEAIRSPAPVTDLPHNYPGSHLAPLTQSADWPEEGRLAATAPPVL
jgi:hypothetical protein